MAGGEPPTGDRPRWSFTWLLRVQRVGRNRRSLGDGPNGARTTRWVVYVVLGGVILIEVAFGLWLGILPR